MTDAVRYAFAFARMHALKSGLWSPVDRGLLVQAGTTPDGLPVSDFAPDVYPSLVRWYATLVRGCPTVSPALLALFRLHEVENVKLLWRAAALQAPLERHAWRPLEPLGTIAPATAASADELVERLSPTPYREIARSILRSHADDLLAAELGFDRWAAGCLRDAADSMPTRERAAKDLLLAVCRERDADLLRRGTTFGLDPDLVAKSTIVLSREHPINGLVGMIAWTPSHGPLASAMPPRLRRIAGPVEDWDSFAIALRRRRLAACRRTFVGWPFQAAPIVAATLLRDEQARATISIAAARRSAPAARGALIHALAASFLEG